MGLQLLGATDIIMPAPSSESETIPSSAPHHSARLNHDESSQLLIGGGWHGPDMRPYTTPYSASHAWWMYRAASWHHMRPDTRVTLHPEYLVTLYDSKYTSLAANNRLPRPEHGLADLSAEDQEVFLAELDGMLRAWNSDTKGEVAMASGADWLTVAQVVVDRAGDTLAELHALLSDLTPASNATQILSNAQLTVFALLMPYIDHKTLFAPGITTTDRASILEDVSKRCGVIFTGHIDAPAYKLTAQERRLKYAVEGVQGRICSFTSAVLEEALYLLETLPQEQNVLRSKLVIWKQDVEDLMGWLGWAMWERCPRMCGWDVSLPRLLLLC